MSHINSNYKIEIVLWKFYVQWNILNRQLDSIYGQRNRPSKGSINKIIERWHQSSSVEDQKPEEYSLHDHI